MELNTGLRRPLLQNSECVKCFQFPGEGSKAAAGLGQTTAQPCATRSRQIGGNCAASRSDAVEQAAAVEQKIRVEAFLDTAHDLKFRTRLGPLFDLPFFPDRRVFDDG